MVSSCLNSIVCVDVLTWMFHFACAVAHKGFCLGYTTEIPVSYHPSHVLPLLGLVLPVPVHFHFEDFTGQFSYVAAQPG
jgi:hypothetical protein